MSSKSVGTPTLGSRNSLNTLSQPSTAAATATANRYSTGTGTGANNSTSGNRRSSPNMTTSPSNSPVVASKISKVWEAIYNQWKRVLRECPNDSMAQYSFCDSGKYDFLMKVILIGDSGVGKSCLLMRFSEDTFNQSFINTVGIDFKIKSLHVDDKIVKLQIYDTAGQERFRTITAAYYRGAQGVMLVYDVTDPRSFRSIFNILRRQKFPFIHLSYPATACFFEWVGGMMPHIDPGCRMIIVGNKCDLDDRKEVPEEKGRSLAEEFGFKFIEASAKTNLRVEEAFNILVREIKNRIDNDAKAPKPEVTVPLAEESPKKPSGCKCGGK